MTKKELSQLRHLKKEIELLQKQIAEADTSKYMVSDVVEGSAKEWPYNKRTFKIEGINVPRYEKHMQRLKKKLERRLEELMEMRERLEEYIDTVPDSLIRQILTLRYVNGLSWRQIAVHIGGGNTADSVRKACMRYLKRN